ncbi:hypothetical protein RRG08_040568 [Elysia crispata]|uniref:Uncharacterized protein n=1 Tax=Elysia crispata TaxID=231223 RepID=A0AAE0Z9U9_9GAST|nr:hypothetical protein RRG08_040568 [Elysia crispata]
MCTIQSVPDLVYCPKGTRERSRRHARRARSRDWANTAGKIRKDLRYRGTRPDRLQQHVEICQERVSVHHLPPSSVKVNWNVRMVMRGLQAPGQRALNIQGGDDQSERPMLTTVT